MEKRALLAVILSLVVLYFWSALMAPQRQKVSPSEESQTIGIKEDMEYSRVREDDLSETFSPKPEDAFVPEAPAEELKSTESDKLTADFSNIGGTLSKITNTEYEASLPLTDMLSIKGYEKKSFDVQEVSRNKARYVYRDSDTEITKQFQFEDDYLIKADITIRNKSEMSKLIDLDINVFTVVADRLDIKNSRDQTLLEYAVFSSGKDLRKSGAFKFSAKEKQEHFGEVSLIGYRDRYFSTIIKPQFQTKGFLVDPVDEKNLKINLKTNQFNLQPEDIVKLEFLIFTGPQKMELLKSYQMDFEKFAVFSGFGLFDSLAKFLYSVTIYIHKIVPNWGACIILVSLLIYGCTYPINAKGLASMKKAQLLQPELAALKEKYKSNPQKMNQEVMELYKKHKVNPFGGCFLLILQMPIFIGMYQVLWRAVFLKGAGFLWIKDLSEPDRLAILPFNLPFIGNEFNLLPLLMMLAMFFQQKVTSKSMVVTDSAQAAQQKMMTVFFPIFIGAIFYKFSSGLNLYFTMFYILSTLTQIKMSKQIKVA